MHTCAYCGKELTQKRFRNGEMEAPSMLAKRKFCDRHCMAAYMTKEICKTASHSREKASRQKKSSCEVCGAKPNRLHVHHVNGNPLDNSPSNLKTLCPSCHRRCHSQNFTETGEHRANCQYCGKPSMKNGLCYTHISRFKRYGHPLAKKRKTASGWVLMLHDGKNWLPFPSNIMP